MSFGGAQFSTIDLDNDGKKDLFVFDRVTAQIFTFLNKGQVGEIKYELSREYTKYFPDLFQWALLHDFNKDGIEDIFTLPKESNSPVIVVYKGRRNGSVLSFERINFGNTDQLTTIDGEIISNTIIDLPAITDIDNDGDTDILVFESGGEKVYYYKNYALENNLSLDNFALRREDDCFGKFKENGLNSKIFLSANKDKCFEGLLSENSGNPRHTGSTLLAFDKDCDGDKELLIGDLSTDSLTLLTNGGTVMKAWFNMQETGFPKDDLGIGINIFVASFFIDVDNDGKRDLIATTNQSSQNENHIWLFLNIGSDCAPKFILETKKFLIENAINSGLYISHSFADINQDGLLDLIIGGRLRQDYDQDYYGLQYFKNIGTSTSPEFDLVNKNFAPGLTNLTSLYPAFADMDNDSDLDMMVGENNGILYYYKNEKGPNEEISYTGAVQKYMNIDVGLNAAPVLYDVNGDGLIDILSGEQQFEMEYYQNYGTPTVPKFSSKKDTASNFNNYGYIYRMGNNSDLLFGKIDYFESGENSYILQGTAFGGLRLFLDLKKNARDSIQLVDENFGDTTYESYSNPKMVDITKDNLYDLIVGSGNNTLRFFKTNIPIKKPISIQNLDDFKFTLSPNPVSETLEVFSNKSLKSLLISDVSGRVLNFILVENGTANINLHSLPSGIYFISARFENGSSVQKFIKQ
jgi:hypothetical protein